MLDALGIELLKHGYRGISYIELHCSHCGDIRGGLPEENPSELQKCPYCRRSCVAQVIGHGFTKREVRWETYNAPASTIKLLRDLKGRVTGRKRPRRTLILPPVQYHPLAVRQREGD